MRIYEFAKKVGASSKDLVLQLRRAGFDVKSHMALLSDQARIFLEKNSGVGAKSALEKTGLAAKKEPVAQSGGERVVKKSSDKIIKQRNGVAPMHAAPSVRARRRGARQQSPEPQRSRPETITLQPLTVEALAHELVITSSQLIILLMRWGKLIARNQVVPVDLVERIAQEFGVSVIQPKEGLSQGHLELSAGAERRLPVVVVLGHVDHGKTTLLDFIRKTRVAAREKGGITQHLGAYEADTGHGKLIFLDTPGHEAFTKIRQRGARVADIAILVVAADDSLMPQTIEAIRHIKKEGIPLVVAINKIDKVSPDRLEVVKRDLSQHDLLPEEWGGDTVLSPISAKEGTGVDALLELVALQADLSELTTLNEGKARGYVLESSMERGRGAAATVLLRQGTLSIGDYFKAGVIRGRVSSIVDSCGMILKKVGPSIPVRVAGFESLPEAGDLLLGIDKAAYKKFGSSKRSQRASARFIPENAIKLIIKTDTKSSKEALLDSIEKLSGKTVSNYDRAIYVVDAEVGDVSESDVLLAESSNARVYTLHVKASPKVKELARSSGVDLVSFDIIYKLLESLDELALSQREHVMVREKVGVAEVRKVFPVKNLGIIAGCYVKDGSIVKNGYIIAYRGSQKIGEGGITSLQSERKAVKEVRAGYECGFIVKEISDWGEGDLAECYIEKKSS